MKRFSIYIAIFVLSLFVINTFGQKTPKTEFEILRENVQNLLKKGDTKNALQILDATKNEAILKNHEFYLLKADVFMKARDFDKANDYFQAAFDFEMVSMFTDLEFCKSSYLTQFQNSFIKCDFAFFSYENLSNINAKRHQDFEKADAMQYLSPFNLKRSEELDAMLEDILFYRGAAFVQTNNFNEAVEYLSLVIKRNPRRLFAHKERAAAFRGLGKIAEAEADEKKEKEIIGK